MGLDSVPIQFSQIVRSDTEPGAKLDAMMWIDTSPPSGNAYTRSQWSGDAGQWEILDSVGDFNPDDAVHTPVVGSQWTDTSTTPATAKGFGGTSFETLGDTAYPVVQNPGYIDDVVVAYYWQDTPFTQFSGSYTVDVNDGTSYQVLTTKDFDLTGIPALKIAIDHSGGNDSDPTGVKVRNTTNGDTGTRSTSQSSYTDSEFVFPSARLDGIHTFEFAAYNPTNDAYSKTVTFTIENIRKYHPFA